jgi:hypothetical protein
MSKNIFTGGEAFGKGVRNATLSDTHLVQILADYRRRVAGGYRALLPEDIDSIPHGSSWVSTKLDGELWFLVKRSGWLALISPKGRVIHGDLPVITAAKDLPDGVIIAGELTIDMGKKRARIGDLLAALAKGDDAAASSIIFCGFDIVELNNAPVAQPYAERYQQLQAFLPETGSLCYVTSQVLNTPQDINAVFQTEVLDAKAEGLVVRHENGLIYKIKPQIHLDAAIIGYSVKTDQPQLIRSMLLGLMDQDQQWIILGPIGNIGDDQQRKLLFEQLNTEKSDSNIRYANSAGSLYNFVTPKTVVEVAVTDLQGELSDGTIPSTVQATFGDQTWRRNGQGYCPKMLHPVMKRIRADKSVSYDDIRVEQVTPYLGALRHAQNNQDLKESTLIRRQVWTKETKGQMAVRKLVVWKTNKEIDDPRYPAFVVHWTDYSPGRAKPLDRDVRPLADEASALAMADQFIEQNIKKGWQPIE